MRLERSRRNMTTIKEMFTTWDGWSEIVIPAAGAIIIPLLIVCLTWFFGASRAERIAEKQKNEENLIYLRSLLIHALKDFLMFRNNILFKRNAINNYDTLSRQDEKKLFAIIPYDTIYSQFEPKEYATMSRTQPNFIFNLLQTKTLMQHIYNRMENFNQTVRDNQDNIAFIIALIRDNLKTFQLDIDDTINHIKSSLDDISYLEKKLNLQLVLLQLEDFEKQELLEALDELKLSANS